MPRRFSRTDRWEYGGSRAPEDESGETRAPKSRKRRLAMTLVWTTLFFAGASIAAVAGDQLSAQGSDLQANAETTTDGTTDSTTTTTTTDTSTDAAPEAPAPDATAPDATAPDATVDLAVAPSDAQGPDAIAPTRGTPTAAPAAPGRGARTGGSKATGLRKAARVHQSDWQKVLLPALKPAPRPEIEGPPSAATVWLNSPLPDPTPPALRLSRKFAKNLRLAAQGNGVSWSVMLGVLRARGADGHAPADDSTLMKLGARLAPDGKTKGDWAAIFSYSRDAAFSDRATALARYDRAVGLNALVNGLEAAKPAIAAKLLADPMVSIYEAGRNDIIQNKVDVRVLAVIAYLRETFGQVTVTSLISGHRLYARPGVISAHIPGHAVDIAALGGVPIQGHQEPGGLTERAVRAILLLPQEVMPRQVISLLGLGGPSFPLGDHYNHIHIGF